MRPRSRTVLVAALAALTVLSGPSKLRAANGTVTGCARFELIKGQPTMGYRELYEWNLFLSPGGPGWVGEHRRLGAGKPPGACDSYYSISAPPGRYSVLVSQPLFYARPKVVPDVVIESGRTTTLNIELCTDYSTYFRDTWTHWTDVWHQTFVATGTFITGVSFVLAGTHATEMRVTVLEDNGNPRPSAWPQVSPAASKTAGGLGPLGDTWVRWLSRQVPTVPGKRYAIRLTGIVGGVDRNFAVCKRDKDARSYAQGRAYDNAGNPMNYDLNITVFSDNDGTVIPYARTSQAGGGPEELRDGYYDKVWGQTFRATGSSLAGVDVWAAGANNQWDLDFTFSVRAGGPAGALIAPVKTTKAGFQAAGAGLHGVSYNPGEVPLEPGSTYYIEFTNPIGFNPYVMHKSEDAYPYGAGYQNRVLKDGGAADVSMTIIEYAPGGTIEGKVVDDAGHPIAAASVSVEGTGLGSLTNAAGEYRVLRVLPGTYTVTASKVGYETESVPGQEVIAEETTVVDFVLTLAPCTLEFRNPSLETSLSPWTPYGSARTTLPGPPWFADIVAHDGTGFHRNEVNWTLLPDGGLYQRFCVEVGHTYRASVWSNIYWIGGNSNAARNRIGLDPAGGETATSASIVWSDWDRRAEGTAAWREISIREEGVEATGPIMTVFLDFAQENANPQPPGGQWRINCFDLVEIEDLGGPAAFFRRGDCNADGRIGIIDAIGVLTRVFVAGATVPCESACDGDDDDGLNIDDALLILHFIFTPGRALPAPGIDCGEDPTPDIVLTCERSGC